MSIGRTARLAVVASLACSLASCGALFEFNVFQSLDRASSPAASDYRGEEGLARLATDLESPATVAAIEADPATLAQIETDLWTTYLADGVSGATDQTAAILYADLVLKTTTGESLVNNAAAILADGVDESQSLAELVGPILPAGAQTIEGFTALIQALVKANEAYLALGQSIDGDGNGIAEGTLPEGALVGDIAEKAAVAAIVSQVIAAIDAATAEDPIQQLYLLIHDPASADAATQGIEVSAALDPADPLPAATDALLDLADITLEI